jgi:hypothetical protein
MSQERTEDSTGMETKTHGMKTHKTSDKGNINKKYISSEDMFQMQPPASDHDPNELDDALSEEENDEFFQDDNQVGSSIDREKDKDEDDSDCEMEEESNDDPEEKDDAKEQGKRDRLFNAVNAAEQRSQERRPKPPQTNVSLFSEKARIKQDLPDPKKIGKILTKLPIKDRYAYIEEIKEAAEMQSVNTYKKK